MKYNAAYSFLTVT